VTAKEAYEKWQAAPEKVMILDSGLPWTYKLTPDRMMLPKVR
jgi:hypothetical protein